jgi:hypothetical protein
MVGCSDAADCGARDHVELARSPTGCCCWHLPLRAASIGARYLSLATTILARDWIYSAAWLHRLHYHGESGALARRTYLLGRRLHGRLFHLTSQLRLSWRPVSFSMAAVVATMGVADRARRIAQLVDRPINPGHFPNQATAKNRNGEKATAEPGSPAPSSFANDRSRWDLKEGLAPGWGHTWARPSPRHGTRDTAQREYSCAPCAVAGSIGLPRSEWSRHFALESPVALPTSQTSEGPMNHGIDADGVAQTDLDHLGNCPVCEPWLAPVVHSVL